MEPQPRLVQASEMLGQFFPQAKPVEPTNLSIHPMLMEAAVYVGFFQGAHQILAACDNPISIRSPLRRVVDVAHELVHQKQAEVLGQEAFFGADLTQTEMERIDLSDPQEWVEQYNRIIKKLKPDGSEITLARYIHEGSATYVEQQIWAGLSMAQQQKFGLNSPQHILIEWSRLELEEQRAAMVEDPLMSDYIGLYVHGYDLVDAYIANSGNQFAAIWDIDYQQAKAIRGRRKLAKMLSDAARIPVLQNRGVAIGSNIAVSA